VKHIPVLHCAVLDILKPQRGESVLDVTAGLGGHGSSFHECVGTEGLYVGVDADEQNLREAERRIGSDHARFIHANFRDLRSFDLPSFDIILADLGLSSPHVDDPERGFSFRENAKLDFRYDRSSGATAAEILNTESGERLEKIFREYGELQRIPGLVRSIQKRRSTEAFESANDLIGVAEEVYRAKHCDVLPQLFQALRIAVNDEMGALESLLESAPAMLRENGRFGIISYHSLEDRLVKCRFRELTSPEKHPVSGSPISPSEFTLLTEKPIRPESSEIEENPRARSARFRAMIHSRSS
jgi:16S rRNA (cytosine1402-N4)-methyltransferase